MQMRLLKIEILSSIIGRWKSQDLKSMELQWDYNLTLPLSFIKVEKTNVTPH